MYQKPLLQKFGVFRELTRVGFNGSSDGASVLGPKSKKAKKGRGGIVPSAGISSS